MNHDQIFNEIFEEIKRASGIFPEWPTDPLHAIAIVGEEFGELTKDMLQMTYEPHKTDHSKIRTEAIQTASSIIRLIASLNRYEYAPCPSHRQGDQS